MSEHETQSGRVITMDAEKDLSLKQRAEQLRLEALKDIGEVRSALTKAQAEVDSYKQDLVESIRVAEGLGIPKDDLAQYAGVSASTIGNWLRGEKEEANEPSTV